MHALRWSTIAFLMLQSSQVVAFELTCPSEMTGPSLQVLQENLANLLASGGGDLPSSAAPLEQIRACFPKKQVPACMSRIEAMLEAKTTILSSSADTHAKDDERKQPPAELIQDRGDGSSIVLKSNVEQIALAKNWPVVRYKSRHSGGFDFHTPSLMMVRVPGDQLSPPVNYDRYINFPIPADDEAEAMNPIPQKTPLLSATELSGYEYTPSTPSTFSIIAVTRATPEKKSEVYFQRYQRSAQRWRPEPPEDLRGCYTCHPNGLRAISPLGYHVRKLENGKNERQMPPEEWLKVREMNESMESAAGGQVVDWRGVKEAAMQRPFLVPEAIGPILGLTVPLLRLPIKREGETEQILPLTRQKEFIMGGVLNGVTYPGCYKNREEVSVRDMFGRAPGLNNVYRLTQEPAVRWQVVRDAMNCASCHGNTGRGALNTRTESSLIDFKILVDQSMPHGYHLNPMDRGSPNAPVMDRLNPNERIALANCLKVEFRDYEQFKQKEWLLETPCDPLASQEPKKP